MTNSITNNIQQLQQHIVELAKQHQRDPNDIQLLAVSKTKPISDIITAYRAGQRYFGENHVQEALAKIEQLAEYDIEWHFIGYCQSNKTQLIATHFSWVHSIDSLKVAQRLNDQRPSDLPPLNILLQINIDQESSKHGIDLQSIHKLAESILPLPHLRLRGLMAIPKPRESFTEQSKPYRHIREAFLQLKNDFAKIDYLDTLSMGMSSDLAAAIAEGATIVRIGTAIFGARNKL